MREVFRAMVGREKEVIVDSERMPRYAVWLRNIVPSFIFWIMARKARKARKADDK